tara:strand:- start:5836 stop:6387 length:552 start_codon:yes stop_codon:yes gene_type:complete
MAGRPYDPKNPYVQQTPRFGGSADLVPPGGQSSTEMALEMAMPTHHNRPSTVSGPSVRAATAGQARGTEVSRVGSQASSRPPGIGITPEIIDEVMERYREYDRNRFKGIYDNNRVEQVAVGRKWDRDTTNIVHGGLDRLRQSDPGAWQLVNDYEDHVDYMDLETGQVVKMDKQTGELDFSEGN